jgi:hypothetical protein
MPQDQHIDKELSPKLVFGLSPKAIEELRQKEKKRRKKVAKNYRPQIH